MKKVMGGNALVGLCTGEPYLLSCTTPNGSEDWCRSSISGDATEVCNGIYPAYHGEGVSGLWGVNVYPH